LREQRYALLRNNCEQFWIWCQGTPARSSQVEALSRPEYAFWKLRQSLQSQLWRITTESEEPAMA
jgi:hypothetical protein